MKPPNWATHPCNLTNDPKNNGFENVDFIVWMRTAALPSFKKLYRLLDRKHDSTYSNGLPAGQYQLVIENSRFLQKDSANKFNYTYLLFYFLNFRLPGRRIQWQEALHHQYDIVDRRQEQLSGNCIHYYWMHLCNFGRYFLFYSYQVRTFVSFLCVRISWKQIYSQNIV